MIKRFIVGIVVALALIGAGIGIGASIDGDWGPRHDAVVVNSGSGAADAGQTIVVSEGHGFFPFGLLFLGLAFLLVASLLRRAGRGGGRCGRGHGPGSGGGPGRLEEWHRRAHEGETTTSGPEQANPA